MLIRCWKGNIFSLFSHKLCPGCSSLHSPGEVVLLVPMPADGPADSWQLLPDGRAASPTTSFTQQDINEGIVWYRHSGTQVESDSFQFQVLLPFIFPQSSSAGIFLWDYLVCHSHCLLTWAFSIYAHVYTNTHTNMHINIYAYLHTDQLNIIMTYIHIYMQTYVYVVARCFSVNECPRVDVSGWMHSFFVFLGDSFVSKKAFTVWITAFDL